MADARAPSRHERRKAETRRRIVAAANELFAERGYLETSVEDIADRADVAVRTIYTHFPSKAAILLDYFDRWLTALVDGILARPVDEPVAAAVEASLAAMVQDGWTDRDYGDLENSPPSALGLVDGPPEVAGHMMHAWMRAQYRIASDASERGGFPPGAVEPQARAAAVFAAALGPIAAASAALDGGAPLPEGATANSLLVDFARHLTGGRL